MIKSFIPRVAAINDLSGFGRVSLTEAIPILSAMGVEVCPLPTAILSTHTYKFENYTFLDMSDEMKKILDHWRSLEIQFDAVCTGYIGSSYQIELIKDFIRDIKSAGGLIVVDPVLGDNALSDVETVYYDRMSDLLNKMKELVTLADVITPNLTEACLLLDEKYPSGYVSEEYITNLMIRLSDLGPERIAITSIMTEKNKMMVGIYDKTLDRAHFIDCCYVDRPFHGTGDIFTAALTGALVKGNDFFSASEIAVDFITAAIRETMRYPDMKIEYGAVFEPTISEYFSDIQKTLD